MPRLSALCRSANAALPPAAARNRFSSGLPRPYASARVSCGNHAPRQRTGLDSVAPSALCAWATLKVLGDWARRIKALLPLHGSSCALMRQLFRENSLNPHGYNRHSRDPSTRARIRSRSLRMTGFTLWLAKTIIEWTNKFYVIAR